MENMVIMLSTIPMLLDQTLMLISALGQVIVASSEENPLEINLMMVKVIVILVMKRLAIGARTTLLSSPRVTVTVPSHVVV